MEEVVEARPLRPFHEDFLRAVVGQEFFHIVGIALSGHKFAGGYVQKRNTEDLFVAGDGCKEIVLLMREYIVIGRYAGSDQFGNTAFDQRFGLFRIFQLVAYGHALAGSYQFGQIGIQRMMRKAGQFDKLGSSVGTPCQRYPQDLGSHDGILRKCFVEISHPEEQDSIRVFLLDLKVLAHQRRFYHRLCHREKS